MASLSRAQVLVLRRLDDAALEILLGRAETFYGAPLSVTANARETLRAMADGDGRYIFNLAEEMPRSNPNGRSTPRNLSRSFRNALRSTTRAAKSTTNLISALHKSIRGSDPDASTLLARTDACGWGAAALSRAQACARRGGGYRTADPQAVVQALAAKDVYDFLAVRRVNSRSSRP